MGHRGPIRDRALWVIDPSVRYPEEQGIEQILRGWPGRSRVFRPALAGNGGPSPEDGHEAAGVVLMGSAASVHEPLPWLHDLSGWLRPILVGRVDLPLLGICFGHQLIAHLAGGEVGFLTPGRDKRLGVETSVLEGGRLLPGRQALRVVVSHREEVTRAPDGYRVVARREGVDIDGLEHVSRPIFSFQFHPEAREEFAEHAGLDAALVDGRVRADSRRLLGAFRARVLESG
jgi:GMP synthase-like glutamine amidotransferase